MIADDLFAGAGGWDLAARELGIEARGVENMKEARATREAAGLTTIHDDVWTFAPDGKATGLIASPPCQTFSAAGKGNGRKALDDVLRGIRDGYVASLDHLRFLGEEVGDQRTALVLTPLHFALTEACAERLRAAGWEAWTGLLHAEMYGVPQTRKRAFLLASRAQAVAPPTPTRSRYYSRTPNKLDPGVKKWVSMAEALGWGLRERPSPTVTGGGTETGGAEPIAKLARYTARPGWVFRSPAPVIASDPRVAPRGCKHPAVGCCSQWPGKRGLQFGAGSVRLTIHEAGVLQSFPADFPWQGAKGRQFLQAGNAVPPGLAVHALAAAAGIQRAEAAA